MCLSYLSDLREQRYEDVEEYLLFLRYSIRKLEESYIKDTPFELPCGTVISDLGRSVGFKFENGLMMKKRCYFNRKGRYIRVRRKRYYI